MTTKYLIAVEGGGSHCRSTLYSCTENKVIQRMTLEQSANVASSRESTLDALQKTILEFASSIGADLDVFKNETELTLCLPGAGKAENVAWLKQELNWAAPVYVTADVTANFIGTHGDLKEGDGFFIGGTGSIAIGYSGDGKILRVGGKGDRNDLCSGYSLGYEAMLLPALAQNPNFQLICDKVAAEHGLDKLDPQTTARPIIAALAPYIFDLAETEEDPAAKTLIDGAINSAVRFITRLSEYGINNFGLTGGVAQRLMPAIRQKLTENGTKATLFAAAATTGPDGALKIAQKLKDSPGLIDKLVVSAMQAVDDAPKPAAAASNPPRMN